MKHSLELLCSPVQIAKKNLKCLVELTASSELFIYKILISATLMYFIYIENQTYMTIELYQFSPGSPISLQNVIKLKSIFYNTNKY